MSRKAQAGETDMGYHKITAAMAVRAGILDGKEIQDAKEKLPDAVFRELYMAEPSDDEGNPFGIAANQSGIAPMSALPPAVWGWD